MDGWTLAIVAALLLGYAGVSRRLERTVLTAPMLFVTAGLVVGPDGVGWLDLGVKSSSVRGLAEATLTLVLFTDASRIDLGALRREVGLPARLLGIGLPLTIAAGTVVGVLALTGLNWLEALVLAIVLAPTDAALGQAVVTDRRLPVRIRQGLNVESGLNDGICVPLLFIALALAEADEDAVTVHHAVHLVVEEIGWGMVGGLAAGLVGAIVLGFVERHRLVAHDWLQVIPLSAAALSYGIAAPLGGSGFIAAFTAGSVFSLVYGAHHGEPTYLVDVGGQVLNAVTFIVFGAAALTPALHVLDWRIAVYAVLSLTVARMLPVLLALIGMQARRPTVAFVGWFGPRGLASIVFAIIVLERSNLPHVGALVATVMATVGLSVFAHGLTALPLTGMYARWLGAHAAASTMEREPAHEHRWRRPPGLFRADVARNESSTMRDDENDSAFGEGGSNLIGRDPDDVGGIGHAPGPVPDDGSGSDRGVRSGSEGTQGGAPGDLARESGTGEAGPGDEDVAS
jgi:NhaP-type Na+/H+ or K+/H+ antiporter